MTNPSAPAHPRLWPRAALAAVALFAGGRMIADSGAGPGEPPVPSAADAFGTSLTPGTRSSARSLPPSPPTRIRIKAIGVDAPVHDLDRGEDNTLTAPPPDDANMAGWDKAGVTPGSTGTAVVAGHVDTHSGPAVFYGLGSLHKTDHVSVVRADGRTAVFSVDAVEVYEKATFPSEKVYRQAPHAELRLITCGGSYTEHDGYSANTVVYAHLTGTS
jgi:hypothetical protein